MSARESATAGSKERRSSPRAVGAFAVSAAAVACAFWLVASDAGFGTKPAGGTP